MPANEPAPSGAALWTGRIMSAIVILFLIFDALIKLIPIAPVIDSMAALGYPATTGIARGLGVITLACALLYAWPRSAVLGAILMTGLLGGAIADTLADDPVLRADVARFDVDQMAFRAMSERFIDELKAGQAHPAQPSMMKYAGTELNKARHELVIAAGGSNAL